MFTRAINTKKILRLPLVVLVFIAINMSFVLIATSQTTYAAPVVGFNPGNIVSENVFTNSQSMTASQIQSFLNSKVPSCDTNGTLRATEYGRSDLTHAQYAAMKGWSAPPFTCLKDYSEGGKVSAQIIYDTAQEFNINPQVLIVLLQKEQSLVTDTWPISVQYQSATGYGCPDTAPCDSQYYGLTNQVRWSARMFRAIMNNSPTWYTPYVIGNNYIQYSPTSSCGGSTVNIVNRSTQALYNYTPYQPNQDSLNAGYGDAPGDCDSHGNRNFYLYFSDWFGSPVYGNLVRTTTDSTVFLVSGDNKYPIASLGTLSALAPLGSVSYVPQAYLDSKTSGPLMGRFIRSNDGSVYLYDRGTKIPFGSCAQVAAFGSTCGDAILLEDGQISSLTSRPVMTNIILTTSGKRFYVSGGTKKEVYDDQSLSLAGIPAAYTDVEDVVINNLAYGTPVIRSDVFVKDRTSGSVSVFYGNAVSQINSDIQRDTFVSKVNTATLDTASIAAIIKGPDLGGYIKASNGDSYLLTKSGKVKLTSTTDWPNSFVLVSDAVLSLLPTVATISPPYTTLSQSDGTIYLITNNQKRAFTAWGDFLLVAPGSNLQNLPNYYLDGLTNGGNILSPGQLVLSSDNATVYMIDGLNSKIPMSTFSPASELGVKSLKVASSDALSHYTTTSYTLSPTVQCGANKGLAIGGNVYSLDLSYATYQVLTDLTCSTLSWKTTAPGFLLGQDGTIYQLTASKKFPIRSYATYVSLGGNATNTIGASSYILNQLQTGTLL
jgi:hypothetical protein